MLLSKALSLTASSLLGSDRAEARTSLDVYLMILSTCMAIHTQLGLDCCSLPLPVLTRRHAFHTVTVHASCTSDKSVC